MVHSVHVDAKTPTFRVEPADELLNRHLDRLESILSQKDGEVRRLKTELDLRILYTKELHAQLQAQVVELTGFHSPGADVGKRDAAFD